MENLDHSATCCPACATKIFETHEAITKISNFVSSINFDDLGKSVVGKMLGLGKK